MKKFRICVFMILCSMLVIGCAANRPKLDEVIVQVNMMPTYHQWYVKSNLVQVYYAQANDIPIELSNYFDEFYDYIYNSGCDRNDIVNADSIYYVIYSVEEKSFLCSTTLYYEKGNFVASVSNAEINISSPYEIYTPSEIENEDAYDWKYCESEELNKLKEIFN